MASIARGGMEVAGTYTARDGTVTPLKYHWEALDLREAAYRWTWGDAEEGFGLFADSLVRKG